MNVERVDFVNVATCDAERSRAWYRDMLGLEPDPQNQDELTAGQVTLTFWEPESQGLEFKPNMAGFAVRVADVEEARAELEAKGVEFENTWDSGVCRMAVALDPDGNAVILHRRYAPYE